MKTPISKLFLYRYRFYLGYTLLGLAFAIILIFLPSLSPGGLSQNEIQSTISSTDLNTSNFFSENIINLPYKLFQSISVSIFGLNLYSVKLPSILIAFIAGLLAIILLNRWFKSNVALISSAITILSPLFLFLAGSGTATILYIFWPLLILWLGSKIIGEKRPHPIIFSSLILVIAFSVYTPHLVYLAILILISIIIHPHIRFSMKVLKLPQIITSFSVALIILSPLIISSIFQPNTISQLFLPNNKLDYLDNISAAFAPFFSFGAAIESVYLSPLFGLATVVLAFIGAIASTSKLFTGRNTVVALLFIFSILASGVNQDIAVIIFIPTAVFVAAGIESILEKWYSLFPENPYARIIGLLPIAAFTSIIILSSFSYTISGYHYSPPVSKQFNNDITLINQHLTEKSILLAPKDSLEYHFYKILEKHKDIQVLDTMPLLLDATSSVATLGKWPEELKLPLSKIITSPKVQNSDRLYIYNYQN